MRSFEVSTGRGALSGGLQAETRIRAVCRAKIDVGKLAKGTRQRSSPGASWFKSQAHACSTVNSFGRDGVQRVLAASSQRG